MLSGYPVGKPTRTAGAQRRGAEAARQHCLAARLRAGWVLGCVRHVDERTATVPAKAVALWASLMAPSSAP
jgi:hypothetical protein